MLHQPIENRSPAAPVAANHCLTYQQRVAVVQPQITQAQAGLPAQPVDIHRLCEAIGPEPYGVPDMPKDLSGVITRPATDKFIIYYNMQDPRPRQRFTIAHELAHYILHRPELKEDYYESILYRGGLSHKQETEANRLARDILVPPAKLDAYIDKHLDQRIDDVAHVFGVTAQLISIQLGVPMDI